MEKTTVTVPWDEGIHLRRAGGLARIARTFRSTIYFRFEGKVADARNILSLLILCASLDAVVDIEASGPDEQEAIRAIDAFFSSVGDLGRPGKCSGEGQPSFGVPLGESSPVVKRHG